VLVKQSQTEVLLEEFFSTLCKLDRYLFQGGWVEEFCDVESQVELLGAHQNPDALLVVADREEDSCSQESASLVEEGLTLALYDAHQLGVTCREIEVFELLSFWHNFVDIVGAVFRACLLENVFENASHLHRFDDFRVLELLAFVHVLDRLVDVVADDGGKRGLHAALLIQNLGVPIRQILPVLNRDGWSECHCLFVVAKLELDLTVLAELAGSEEVASSFLQAVLLPGIGSVCHRHTSCVLESNCLLVCHLGVLCHVNNRVGRELI